MILPEAVIKVWMLDGKIGAPLNTGVTQLAIVKESGGCTAFHCLQTVFSPARTYLGPAQQNLPTAREKPAPVFISPALGWYKLALQAGKYPYRCFDVISNAVKRSEESTSFIENAIFMFIISDTQII